MKIIILTAFLFASLASAQTPEQISETPEEALCFNQTTCDECLGLDCAWAVGGCLPTCDYIADAPCYSFEYFNGTAAGICAVVAADEADSALCSARFSCETCTETLKSDGVSPCEWYADSQGFSYCGTGGCDQTGLCGSLTCDGTMDPVDSMVPAPSAVVDSMVPSSSEAPTDGSSIVPMVPSLAPVMTAPMMPSSPSQPAWGPVRWEQRPVAPISGIDEAKCSMNPSCEMLEGDCCPSTFLSCDRLGQIVCVCSLYFLFVTNHIQTICLPVFF